MLKLSTSSRSVDRSPLALIERLLHSVSAYGIPLVIGLFSLIALLAWNNQYSSGSGQRINFHPVKDEQNVLTPLQAAALAAQSQGTYDLATHLSEAPFWLFFHPQLDGREQSAAIEFPSRHALSVQCWDAKSGIPLGSGNRATTSGRISAVRAGFSLAIDAGMGDLTVVCKSVLSGPGHISVSQWSSPKLEIAARAFDRNSGLLDGGLIVLGIFVLITAIINRDSTYMLFSGWLLVNLRMAALSTGSDMQWFGHAIPYEWLIGVRAITLAVYYMLTVTLFRSLFSEELNQVKKLAWLQLVEITILPVLGLAVLLPYQKFLPIFWTATGFTVVVLISYLIRILVKTRSPVAVWYGASLGITLCASLYEVIAAAVGIRVLLDSVNSVTAALSSSLLAALAIAAQLRVKHQKWVDAKAELQHTYDVMPIGLFTLGLNGNFISANPIMLGMIGMREVDTQNRSWADYFGEEAWLRLRQLVTSGSEGELEIQSELSPAAESKYFLVQATLAKGRIEGFLQDITARYKATEELQYIANNDPLTKVLNRRGIEAVLRNVLANRTDAEPLALAYLDLDRFKLINDLYGHGAGDDVLKQVCARITSMLNGPQQVGRVGGDEFVIVFPGSSIEAATWICRGMLERVGMKPYPIGDKAFQVRGSIGLIEVSPGATIQDSVSMADRACRQAKLRTDGLVVYEKNALAIQERKAELYLVERLSNPQGPEGLFLEMQPIMSLKQPHASLNFEVLLRMRESDGSVISGGRIIPAAESSGHVGVIDRWVLATTLEWLDKHLPQLENTQFVCMNLSGASLNDERFVDDAFQILERNRRVTKLLCLEITESVALHDLANTRRFIDRVRGYGVKIALDDFGAGYTSFTYLKDLPADVLKIDGNFVVSMNSHPANVAIVEAIVNLARNLGMKTVAEWAEDNATVQALVEVGVDYVQGYAVSRPQSSERILAGSSSASFIENRELDVYAHTLSQLADISENTSVVSLVTTGRSLISV